MACEAHLTREAEQQTGDPIEQTSADAAERTLKDLASGLVTIQSDIVQFPVTYYFHNDETRFSLPAAMPYLDRLAARAGGPKYPPEVRLRATMLRTAVDDFSSLVASEYLHGYSSTSTGKVLEAYARDHSYAPHKRRASGEGS